MKTIKVILDVLIAISVALVVGNDYKEYRLWLILGFASCLLTRILIEAFGASLTERILQLEKRKELKEKQKLMVLQEETYNQMIKAIKNGDVSKYEVYKSINEEIKDK